MTPDPESSDYLEKGISA